MEHRESVITHDEKIRSYVSPPQSCNVSLHASMRKNDQERTLTEFLLGAPGVPESWRNQEVLMSDGTKKGTENLLVNLREAVLSSSETANTVYVEAHSDRDAGIHYVSKLRLCQWTQSEAVSTTTGQGQTILKPNTYKFVARLLGQRPVALVRHVSQLV